VKPARVAGVVVVLAAAAFVGVALLTGSPAPSPAGPAPGDAAPGSGTAPMVELLPSATTSVAAVPAALTPEEEWARVEVAVRPAGLGPELAAPVSDGLDALRDSMDRCFAAERAHPHRPALRGAAAQGPAVLVLRLEATAAGRLAIAGTELETTGFSSRELVECCQEAAKGYELPATGLETGRRYRVKMLLQ
jgi:hypothetical protein